MDFIKDAYAQGSQQAEVELGIKRDAGELLAKVPRQSPAPSHYHVRRKSDGRMTCSCPDYTYRRRRDGGACKHISGYLDSQKAKKD